VSVGSRQTGTVKTSSEVSDSSRSTHRSAFHNWPDHPGSASCAKLGQGDGGLVQRDLTDPVPEVIRVTFHTSRAPLAHPVLAVALVAALNKHRGVGSRDFCGQRPTVAQPASDRFAARREAFFRARPRREDRRTHGRPRASRQVQRSASELARWPERHRPVGRWLSLLHLRRPPHSTRTPPARSAPQPARNCAAKGATYGLDPQRTSHAHPLPGRQPENLGEDPLLASTLASAESSATKSQNVLVTAKHYVGNNQGYWRTGYFTSTRRTTAINDQVSQRALHEIYERPFDQLVTSGGADAVMCSYNAVNGTQVRKNKPLLDDIKSKFNDIVTADFRLALRDQVAAADAGVDLPQYDQGKWWSVTRHLHVRSGLPVCAR